MLYNICFEDTQIVTVYFEFASQNMFANDIKMHIYVYMIMILVHLGIFFDLNLHSFANLAGCLSFVGQGGLLGSIVLN